MNGSRLCDDLPITTTRTLSNEQQILIPEAVVRWSGGREFAIENLAMDPHTQARLRRSVKRLAQEPRRLINE